MKLLLFPLLFALFAPLPPAASREHYGAVTYPINSLFAALAAFGTTVPDPRAGSYNLLNIRAGYRFWQQKAAAGYFREAEVAVSAFNALNDRHKEHPLGETIGSRVMGWLTLNLKERWWSGRFRIVSLTYRCRPG